jgi:aminoglycoside phosphotransferase (APT) family kinase protein
VLTPAQLQSALDRFGLGRLRAAEPAPGGLFGQNIFVSTSEGEFVLRGCPHYDWQFPQEAWFARLIHDCTAISAPWPYLIEPEAGTLPWSYAIMPRLSGLQVTEPVVRVGLGEDDKREIARALGAGLARLHEFKAPFFGPYDRIARESVADTRPFPQVILDSLDGWYERCRAASAATTDDDIAWCRATVAANIEALDVPFEPAIVHHDYKEANCVFQREGKGWAVSGVFDLMECYFGDPEEDLVRAIGGYGTRNLGRARSFLDGYRSAAGLRPGQEERFCIYMLRDCLLLWEYGQRNKIWFGAEMTFRTWAGPYVELRPFRQG